VGVGAGAAVGATKTLIWIVMVDPLPAPPVDAVTWPVVPPEF
jgi:hypothetical protein